MDEILESIYGKIHPVFDEKMNILVGNIHFLKHRNAHLNTKSKYRSVYRVLPLNKLSHIETNFAIYCEIKKCHSRNFLGKLEMGRCGTKMQNKPT